MNIRHEKNKDYYTRAIDVVIKCNLMGICSPKLILRELLNDLLFKSNQAFLQRSFFNSKDASTEEVVIRDFTRMMNDSAKTTIPAVMAFLNENASRLSRQSRFLQLISAFLSFYEHYRIYLSPELNNLLSFQDIWSVDVSRYVGAMLLCLSGELRPRMRANALVAIVNLSEWIPSNDGMRADIAKSLLEYLSNYPGQEIHNAIIALRKWIPAEYHADIIHNLKLQIDDPDSQIVISVIRAIKEFAMFVTEKNCDDILGSLNKMMSNSRKSLEIRLAAMHALAALLHGASPDLQANLLKSVLALTRDAQPELRMTAGKLLRQFQGPVLIDAIEEYIDSMLHKLDANNANLSAHVPSILCSLLKRVNGEQAATIINHLLYFMEDETKLMALRLEILTVMMDSYHQLPLVCQKQFLLLLQKFLREENPEMSLLASQFIASRKEWLFTHANRDLAVSLIAKLKSPDVHVILEAGKKLVNLSVLLDLSELQSLMEELLNVVKRYKNTRYFAPLCQVLCSVASHLHHQNSMIVSALSLILYEPDNIAETMIAILKSFVSLYSCMDVAAVESRQQAFISVISNNKLGNHVRIQALNEVQKISIEDEQHHALLTAVFNCANDNSESIRIAAYNVLANSQLRFYQHPVLEAFFASMLASPQPMDKMLEIMLNLKNLMPVKACDVYMDKFIRLFHDHAAWDAIRPEIKSRLIKVMSLYVASMSYSQKLTMMCLLRPLISSEEITHEYKSLFLKIYGEYRKDLIFSMLKKVPSQQDHHLPNEIATHVMSMT